VKFLILIFIVLNILNGNKLSITNKDIKYKELLKYEFFTKAPFDGNIRCIPFNIDLLKSQSYQATHYIFKGKPICTKDVKLTSQDKVFYDFGNIYIEKNAKIIGETNKYVKIKNTNGSVDKIYKNGQLK
jgi:hypothetical protein